jgi:excisionase family DNA binding protein
MINVEGSSCQCPGMELAKLEPMMRTKEVAEVLRVSTRTVIRMADQGLLKRVSIGPRMVRFRREDVLSLLEHAEG